MQNAVIFGVQGTQLLEQEKQFFRQAKPLGFILFARNIQSKEQVKTLVGSLKELVGGDCPVLVDQEGGRVARLKAPEWPEFPSMGALAEQGEQACYDNARAIAHELSALGINVDCAPVCDLLFDGADAIIGDRSFGRDVEQVSRLARAMANGLHDGKVLSVIKHIPGHGRALCDSHKDLPVVDAPLEALWQSDFKVFEMLADLPWAMTAHIVYSAIDSHAPATQSAKVVQMIRQEIGFDGVLLSDDLSMKALKGSFEERTARSLEAGCDVVLHCNGDMDEMQQVASGIAVLSDKAQERLVRSLSGVGVVEQELAG